MERKKPVKEKTGSINCHGDDNHTSPCKFPIQKGNTEQISTLQQYNSLSETAKSEIVDLCLNKEDDDVITKESSSEGNV